MTHPIAPALLGLVTLAIAGLLVAQQPDPAGADVHPVVAVTTSDVALP